MRSCNIHILERAVFYTSFSSPHRAAKFDLCCLLLIPGLMCIKEMSDDMLQSADLDFSTSGVTGQEVQLNPKYNKITPDNRQEYVRSAIKYR